MAILTNSMPLTSADVSARLRIGLQLIGELDTRRAEKTFLRRQLLSDFVRGEAQKEEVAGPLHQVEQLVALGAAKWGTTGTYQAFACTAGCKILGASSVPMWVDGDDDLNGDNAQCIYSNYCVLSMND